MTLVNWPNINIHFFRRLPTHIFCRGSGVLMRGSHPPGSVPPPYSHYPARLLMPDLATPPGPGPLSSPPPGPVATNTSPAALDSR